MPAGQERGCCILKRRGDEHAAILNEIRERAALLFERYQDLMRQLPTAKAKKTRKIKEK
ncbi:MAG: hypothetical protein U1F20_05700 [Lysobacterales bacterium]